MSTAAGQAVAGTPRLKQHRPVGARMQAVVRELRDLGQRRGVLLCPADATGLTASVAGWVER